MMNKEEARKYFEFGDQFNGNIGPKTAATYVANREHRYIQGEWGKFVYYFVALKARDYEQKRYDPRNEWCCKMCKDMWDAYVKANDLGQESIDYMFEQLDELNEEMP